MPVVDVAANSAATSSWANSVADAIQELEGDLYPTVYGQLAIPWASITGKPAAFVPILGPVTPQTAYGSSSGNGATGVASDAGHTHGTPALPTAAQVGAPAAFTSPATPAGGKRIYVGSAAPSGMGEGDVWIKG